MYRTEPYLPLNHFLLLTSLIAVAFSSQNTLLRKLFLRCTKIKIQAAFAALALHARNAIGAQLDETTNHAKELKSQLSCHLDTLKSHAANELFMVFHRQAHHKIRRAFYILLTQAEKGNELQYLVQSIVARTGRRKLLEAWSVWRTFVFVVAVAIKDRERKRVEEQNREAVRARAGARLVRAFIRTKKKVGAVDAFSLWRRAVYAMTVIEKDKEYAMTVAEKDKEMKLVEQRNGEKIRAGAGARLVRAFIRTKKKVGTVDAFCYWKVYVRECIQRDHDGACQAFAAKSLSHACNRLFRGRVVRAWSKWASFVDLMKGRTEKMNEVAHIIRSRSREMLLSHAFSQFSAWICATNAVSHAVRLKIKQALAMSMSHWRAYTKLQLIVSHTDARKLHAVRTLFARFSKCFKSWFLKIGFENLRSWRNVTRRVASVMALRLTGTMRTAMATWRIFVSYQRTWEIKAASAKRLVRSYRAVCDKEVRQHFYKWLYLHNRYEEMALALGGLSKVVVENVCKRSLSKAFRRWVMHIFSQREETIYKVRRGEERSDELRRRVYGILTSVSGTSMRNIAAANSAAFSNVVNTSSFTTRLASLVAGPLL